MKAFVSVCIFVKVPRPGAVKTRLASVVGNEAAAMLARAFFLDTLAFVRKLEWARPIVATDGDWSGFSCELDGFEVWPQGEGDLGARLERVLSRALSTTSMALAIGTDTPALPPRMLAEARRALELGTAALGPCADGGFYLLGLRACPPGLLTSLPWSSSDTCVRTTDRLRAFGFEVALLEPSFDVDHASDLARLRAELERGDAFAPHTTRALEALPHPTNGTRP